MRMRGQNSLSQQFSKVGPTWVFQTYSSIITVPLIFSIFYNFYSVVSCNTECSIIDFLFKVIKELKHNDLM